MEREREKERDRRGKEREGDKMDDGPLLREILDRGLEGGK
jgi:hypothetical protein